MSTTSAAITSEFVAIILYLGLVQIFESVGVEVGKLFVEPFDLFLSTKIPNEV